MAKIGISIKIDVTKIDKTRLFKGEKGTYLDLITFVDTDNKDQYENNGFISQSITKDEKAAGHQTPILGNCRVFYQEQQKQHNQSYQQHQAPQQYAQAPQNRSVQQPAMNQRQPNPRQPVNDYDEPIPF